jgi:hypothetical protein
MTANHARMQTTINGEIMRDVTEPVGVAVEFRYLTRDPLAIQLEFDLPGHGHVTRRVGRDLLAEGMNSRVGEDVVRVSPIGGLVLVDVGRPVREFLCSFLAEELAEFVRSTYALVPVDHEAEFLDIDSVLDRLIANS